MSTTSRNASTFSDSLLKSLNPLSNCDTTGYETDAQNVVNQANLIGSLSVFEDAECVEENKNRCPKLLKRDGEDFASKSTSLQLDYVDSKLDDVDVLSNTEAQLPPVKAPPRRKKKKLKVSSLESSFEKNGGLTFQTKLEKKEGISLNNDSSKQMLVANHIDLNEKAIIQISETKARTNNVADKTKYYSTSENQSGIYHRPRNNFINISRNRPKESYCIPGIEEKVNEKYQDFAKVNQGRDHPDLTNSLLHYVKQHVITLDDPKSRWKRLRFWQMPRISLVCWLEQTITIKPTKI